jgi:hypothetical protein
MRRIYNIYSIFYLYDLFSACFKWLDGWVKTVPDLLWKKSKTKLLINSEKTFSNPLQSF